MKAQTQRALRRWHTRIGVFFAPAILLFAFSGALQTFGFHEAQGAVRPPRWIAVIAALHKDQALPRDKAASGHDAERAHDDHHDHDAKGDHAKAATNARSPFPLKVFTGLLSIGLMLSTAVGLALALTTRATRMSSLAAFAAGIVVPLVLLAL